MAVPAAVFGGASEVAVFGGASEVAGVDFGSDDELPNFASQSFVSDKTFVSGYFPVVSLVLVHSCSPPPLSSVALTHSLTHSLTHRPRSGFYLRKRVSVAPRLRPEPDAIAVIDTQLWRALVQLIAHLTTKCRRGISRRGRHRGASGWWW